MEKFVYVYGDDSKKKMIDLGYKLLKSDEKGHEYIFLNQPVEKFEKLEIDYYTSNTLLF